MTALLPANSLYGCPNGGRHFLAMLRKDGYRNFIGLPVQEADKIFGLQDLFANCNLAALVDLIPQF
jgi:hypothetical protein